MRTEKFGQIKESMFARLTNLYSFHSMGSFIPEQAEILFVGELGLRWLTEQCHWVGSCSDERGRGGNTDNEMVGSKSGMDENRTEREKNHG